MTDTRQALAAQRKQFEAWCIQRWRGDRNALLRNLPDAKDHPDEYKMGPIEFAWQAYRAALSAQPVAGAVADDEAEFTGANFDRRTDVIGLVQASLAAPQPQSAPAPEPICQPNGLMFDALGEPRTRYVRVSLHGSHCVMHPSEGDTYLKDARENGDESPYVADNVWLSEREFDNLGEFDGF